MGASLSWTISESSVNVANNTSKVTVKLSIKATNSYNHSGCSGWIKIDGTKYSFTHSFNANSTTVLATKSKTVTHNADGSKSCAISCAFSTGVSVGTLAKSTTYRLTKINRKNTIILDPRGGTISGNSGHYTKTKDYGKTITLPTPVRTNYVFKGWTTERATNSTNWGINYNTSYSRNDDCTLYAAWWSKHTLRYLPNATSPSASGSMLPTNCIRSTPVQLSPNCFQRVGYDFLYWTFTQGGSGTHYSDRATITISNSLIETIGDKSIINLYAQWKVKKYTITFNANQGSGSIAPIPLDHYDRIELPSGDSLTPPSGYKFIGWSPIQSTPGNIPATTYGANTIYKIYQSRTLYAVWADEYAPPQANLEANRYDIYGNVSSGGKTIHYECNIRFPKSYNDLDEYVTGNQVKVEIFCNSDSNPIAVYDEYTEQSDPITGDLTNNDIDTTLKVRVTDISTNYTVPSDSDIDPDDNLDEGTNSINTSVSSIKIEYKLNEISAKFNNIAVDRSEDSIRDCKIAFDWETKYDGDKYVPVSAIKLFANIIELNLDEGGETDPQQLELATITVTDPENPDLPITSGNIEYTSNNQPFELNRKGEILCELIDSNDSVIDSFTFDKIISYGTLGVHINASQTGISLFGFLKSGETGLIVNNTATIQNSLLVNEGLTVNGTSGKLSVINTPLELNNRLTVQEASITNDLRVEKAVNIGGNLIVGGSIIAGGPVVTGGHASEIGKVLSSTFSDKSVALTAASWKVITGCIVEMTAGTWLISAYGQFSNSNGNKTIGLLLSATKPTSASSAGSGYTYGFPYGALRRSSGVVVVTLTGTQYAWFRAYSSVADTNLTAYGIRAIRLA